jgi:hypothetical protein
MDDDLHGGVVVIDQRGGSNRVASSSGMSPTGRTAVIRLSVVGGEFGFVSLDAKGP